MTPAGGGVDVPEEISRNAHPGRVVCPSSPSRRPAVAARPGRLHLHGAAGRHRSTPNNFNFPHTQSFDAINLLKSVAPAHSGDTEEVVFGTSGGARLTDPAIGQRINAMVDEINALPHVTAVTSPYDAAGNLVNTDQHQRGPDRRVLPGPLRQAAEQHLERREQEVRRHRDHTRRATA